MKNPTVYGRLLTEAMKRADMTIQKLSAASGVSPTSIVYYRNGYRDPTRERMIEIARALNEPITAFFDDDEFDHKTPLQREESTVLALLDAGYVNLSMMIQNTTMNEQRIDRTLQRLRQRDRIEYDGREWHVK